ncbi:MAG TPA: hypothetical protein PKO44_00005, partial [Candidatus Omnitrophota bacterium]|nr:hypothetical protein [Candidatus Omnitrophota bacterium]
MKNRYYLNTSLLSSSSKQRTRGLPLVVFNLLFFVWISLALCPQASAQIFEGTSGDASTVAESNSETYAYLDFSVSPSDNVAVVPFTRQPTIAIRNGLGQTITTGDLSNDNINFSIYNNAGQGTLLGTSAATLSGGTASAVNLGIDKPGEMYTLSVTNEDNPNVIDGISNAFNIYIPDINFDAEIVYDDDASHDYVLVFRLIFPLSIPSAYIPSYTENDSVRFTLYKNVATGYQDVSNFCIGTCSSIGMSRTGGAGPSDSAAVFFFQFDRDPDGDVFHITLQYDSNVISSHTFQKVVYLPSAGGGTGLSAQQLAKIDSINWTDITSIRDNVNQANWADLGALTKSGINWNDVRVLYSRGVNWTDFAVQTKAGTNWADLATLTKRGINWTSLYDVTSKGVNWQSLFDLTTRGINWTDINMLSKAGVNWVDIGHLSRRGINWLSIVDLSSRGINWMDIHHLTKRGVNWSDVNVLSKAGVNWTGLRDVTRAVVNWADIRQMSRAGTNWTDINVISRAGANWADMRMLTRAGTNWTDISNMSRRGTAWASFKSIVDAIDIGGGASAGYWGTINNVLAAAEAAGWQDVHAWLRLNDNANYIESISSSGVNWTDLAWMSKVKVNWKDLAYMTGSGVNWTATVNWDNLAHLTTASVNWTDLKVMTDKGLNWADLSTMTKQGVNWLSLYDLSSRGVNWLDINVLTRKGVNWDGIYEISRKGINWTSIYDLSAKGTNWLSIYDLSSRGINWSDINTLSKRGVNWTDLQHLTSRGINWTSVYDLSSRGINWLDINVLTRKGVNWDG